MTTPEPSMTDNEAVAAPLLDRLRDANEAALRFQSQAEHRIQSEFCPACGARGNESHRKDCTYPPFVMALVSPDELTEPSVVSPTEASDAASDAEFARRQNRALANGLGFIGEGVEPVSEPQTEANRGYWRQAAENAAEARATSEARIRSLEDALASVLEHPSLAKWLTPSELAEARRRGFDLLKASQPHAHDASLDVAWKEAEAALPEGYALEVRGPGRLPDRSPIWFASAWHYHDGRRRTYSTEGPTPQAALQALTQLLASIK